MDLSYKRQSDAPSKLRYATGAVDILLNTVDSFCSLHALFFIFTTVRTDILLQPGRRYIEQLGPQGLILPALLGSPADAVQQELITTFPQDVFLKIR